MVFVAVIIAGGIWYRNKKEFDPSVDLRTFKTAGEYENYYKNLDELYKKDTYGGATPEETLALFIDALKKGDTDLAAKYFVPEKQKNETEDLAIGKRKGILVELVNILEKNKKGSYSADKNYFEFNTFDKNNIAEFSFSLVFNPSTKIWKIESI
ncbi:MAG: hypothetical protein AAB488_01310 [Patescibacteria group bacterium]